MNFTDIKYTPAERASQKSLGIGQNQEVLASDFNSLIYILNNLHTLLPDAADDAAAAALTPTVPIGGLYRSTSTIKVRVA